MEHTLVEETGQQAHSHRSVHLTTQHMGINNFSLTRQPGLSPSPEQNKSSAFSRFREKMNDTIASVNARVQVALDNTTEFLTRERYLPGQEALESRVSDTITSTRDAISDIARRSNRATKALALSATAIAGLTACGTTPGNLTGPTLPQAVASATPTPQATPTPEATASPEVSDELPEINVAEQYAVTAPGEVRTHANGFRTITDIIDGRISVHFPLEQGQETRKRIGITIPDEIKSQTNSQGGSLMLGSILMPTPTQLLATNLNSDILLGIDLASKSTNIINQGGMFKELGKPFLFTIDGKEQLVALAPGTDKILVNDGTRSRVLTLPEVGVTMSPITLGTKEKPEQYAIVSHTDSVNMYDLSKAQDGDTLSPTTTLLSQDADLTDIQYITTNGRKVAFASQSREGILPHIKGYEINAMNTLGPALIDQTVATKGNIGHLGSLTGILSVATIEQENGEDLIRHLLYRYPYTPIAIQNTNPTSQEPILFREVRGNMSAYDIDILTDQEGNPSQFAITEIDKVTIYQVTEKGTLEQQK